MLDIYGIAILLWKFVFQYIGNGLILFSNNANWTFVQVLARFWPFDDKTQTYTIGNHRKSFGQLVNGRFMV